MRKGTQLLLIYLQTKTPFLPLTLPMELTAENKLKKLIVVGDRVLIKPLKESDKTTSGILLPPGVREKEKRFCGGRGGPPALCAGTGRAVWSAPHSLSCSPAVALLQASEKPWVEK